MASIPAGTGRRFAWETAAVCLLLALYLALTLSAVRRKSTTYDETSHLARGYARWQTGDYHFPPENGLPQAWATLALLPGSWNFPSLDTPPWSTATSYQLGQQFLYHSGNDADALLFRARAFSSLLAAALGVLVYAWSRRLFGRVGALISVTAFATCPVMLAHGSLVTPDTAATLFFTASVWALWNVLHRVTPWTVLVSALAMAGLFLSKMSAVLFVPAGLLLTGLRLAARRPLTLGWCGRERLVRGRGAQAVLLAGLALGHAVLVWAAIWAFFEFRYEAIRPDRPSGGAEYARGWSEYLAAPGPPMRAVAFARRHRLLPEPFLLNAAATVYYSRARVTFLNGEHRLRGRAVFFPYCLLVKTAPALLALLVLSAAAGAARVRAGGRQGWAGGYDLLPLATFLAVYWAFAVSSNLNIGNRHLLPTYPAMYILAGGAALWLTPGARTVSARAAAVGLCLLAALGEAAWAWPHYLAHFNLFAGGPSQGYKHLVDSSLDWGQDLKELAGWLEAHGLNDGKTPVYLSYFGTGEPSYYGIRANLLACNPPVGVAPTTLAGGTYCISATMLQGVYAYFSLYKSRWGTGLEQAYQQIVWTRHQLERVRDNPAAVGQLLDQCGVRSVPELLDLYEESLFARLRAAMRRRQPDAMVGYSILIYQLTDQDIHDALLGPPPNER